MHYSKLLSLLPLLPLATAICPGYNYAFFNDDDNAMFYTTTTDCVVVKGEPCTNVCMCEWWGCGPGGSVNSVKVNGLWYKCRNDANKGKCGPNEMSQVANNAPESCCRNDGSRNLAEGRITKRHASVIDETNAILDRHVEEYEHAKRSGLDLDEVRRQQKVEVAEAMGREEAVAGVF
ncbi:hypothetical protein ASPVEDRAFT_30490 [Aspergillus versicolor CBS 583.65]|uniref:Uncharacterized protein n=1 Tax=Aspergillus versicolor CBS 583.65 TaxID=1036611 RepID=A0A1L9PR58_ASPVE|nr:uncharacterized protein ASPVEDRAFT_30490 [Aspergillus versicolor CBS 583.65]OJJ04009.1 hypothetical protein ASPVEDRAFT_30490 [Aspergillus versicolor CBS 583.65]